MKSRAPTSFGDGTQKRRWGMITALGVFLVLLVGLVLGVAMLAHPGKSVSASTVDNVYISTGDGILNKLNGSTGAALWHTQVTDRNLPASPAIANGVAYFGTLGGNFYALNANTGQTIWHNQMGDNIISSPVVVNNVVYIGSDNNYIYALNASNGSVLWRFDAGVGNETVATRSVAVANGVVYGSSSDQVDHSYLFAINATNGQQLWRDKVLNQLFTDVKFANGTIYLASSAITKEGGPHTTDSYVYAYDPKTGSRLWISGKIGNLVLSAPTIANGVVYVGSQDDAVYALNASTGAKIWRQPLAGPINTSPVVANGNVYVGVATGQSTAAPSRTSDVTTTTGSIVALNASTGKLVWQQQQINDYMGTPLVYANNLIYVGNNTNKVYAFNAATSNPVWSYQMNSAVPFNNAPIAAAP